MVNFFPLPRMYPLYLSALLPNCYNIDIKMTLSSKRIMLTGGAGFLGSFVAEKLKARGCKHIFIPKE